MNYPQKQFEELVRDLPVLLKHFGLQASSLEGNISLQHDLHFRLFTNKNYPDDNANVIKKEDGVTRLFPKNEEFLLYPEKCNDDQIETAMRKAAKILINEEKH
jgi:hypothetical protein